MNKVEVLAALIKDRMEFTRLVNDQLSPILERWAFVLRDVPDGARKEIETVQGMLDLTIARLTEDLAGEGHIEHLLVSLGGWPTTKEIEDLLAGPGPYVVPDREHAWQIVINRNLVRFLLAANATDAESLWRRSEKNKQKRISKREIDGDNAG